MEISGHCDERFSVVQDAFESNFLADEELGASAAVTVEGQYVVDLWGGERNKSGDPWEEDTIVNVYSTTKTMASICMLMLADRGLIDFEAPVADYWPKFAANGKDSVLVRHVMTHQTGCSGFPRPVTVEELYDHDLMADLLAGMQPWWEPGTAPGYHAITQGTLQAELLRRVDGRTLGTFFRDEVTRPLNADFHIGLPLSEGHRVAQLDVPKEGIDQIVEGQPDSVALRTFRSCRLDGTETETDEWRSAEIPAGGGIGNARSISRVHSAVACGGTIDGITLMNPETIEAALDRQTFDRDLVLGLNVPYGTGFGINHERIPLTPSDRTLYWFGWGGSMGVMDLDEKITISYAMNKMAAGLVGDTRAFNLIAATYAAIGK
ncbi:MAG TPA: serine hydrolase domain-containing protein [Acidimicrobiales bacterium]|jgi:CubicO group peptidase (beta-lactamase class C family)|nr:serine hydrolase domain-containing protein [Acidimicrobiales bacterium]|tara:strand:+ start:1149 stop:2282 length:1134 start_codon:yes stop_codon:yes gene_type:complete